MRKFEHTIINPEGIYTQRVGLIVKAAKGLDENKVVASTNGNPDCRTYNTKLALQTPDRVLVAYTHTLINVRGIGYQFIPKYVESCDI